MAVNPAALEIANNFELVRPLPAFESRLRKGEVVELLEETIRLQRLSRYIVLLAASTIPTPTSRRPVRLNTGAEQMIAGGAVYGHRADGIIQVLDIVARRRDEENWSNYINQHLDMPEWLENRLH